MKKMFLSVITTICAFTSCVSRNSDKITQRLDDKNGDSLVLYKDNTKVLQRTTDTSREGINMLIPDNMVRIISNGPRGKCDTIVYEKDVERIQEKHHMNFGGPFHSRSIKKGINTHYSCTHSSHTSHYSSSKPW